MNDDCEALRERLNRLKQQLQNQERLEPLLKLRSFCFRNQTASQENITNDFKSRLFRFGDQAADQDTRHAYALLFMLVLPLATRTPASHIRCLRSVVT